MEIRCSKVLITLAMGLFFSVVTLNNLIDYSSNFAFVEGVLKMEGVFPSNYCLGRALSYPWIHHAFYCLIIFWEMAAAFFILLGAFRLFRGVRSSSKEFNHLKGPAILNLFRSG